METDNVCRACNREHGVDGWNPRHPSVIGDGPLGSLPRRDKREDRHVVHPIMSATPFDPVLRQALIDKGVLTPGDLQAAQEKINVITGAVVQGVTHRSAEGGASRSASSD